MDLGLVAGVVALGAVHGVLPDHGWPIAATYALDRPRKWISGTLAALILGIGHLFSSVVLVLAYFWFATFAAFAEGPWLKPLAGVVLVALGLYEYLNRGHGHGHLHGDDHEREHDHAHGRSGFLSGLRGRLPGGGHNHHHHLDEHHAEKGLRTLGVTALVLGFAHEEPIQILAICAGTNFCLELMLLYSVAVIVAILVPTLLLIAGYQSHKARVEQYTPYLPVVTAIVLVGVGTAFIFGVF